MKSGVYAIKNKVNGRIYIGSSTYITGRKASHFSLLRRNLHHVSSLQDDFNKYGEDSFLHIVISRCENYRDIEQLWLDKLYPTGILYNEKASINGFGYKFSDETLKKKSESSKRVGTMNDKVREKAYTKEAIEKRAKKRALDFNIALDIKGLLLQGKSYNSIAKQLGTTHATVSKIARGVHAHSKELGGSLEDWAN